MRVNMRALAKLEHERAARSSQIRINSARPFRGEFGFLQQS